MQSGNKFAELFSFRFQPILAAQGSEDGGFQFSMYGNNTVVFHTYHSSGMILSMHTFEIKPEIIGRYLSMADAQSWWMSDMPLNVSTNLQPQTRSYFTISGHPSFTFDDIVTVANMPFNAQRGLLARRLLGILESVADMLVTCGIYVTPWSFQWDDRSARVLVNQMDRSVSSRIG